jgi:hypothetical protein
VPKSKDTAYNYGLPQRLEYRLGLRHIPLCHFDCRAISCQVLWTRGTSASLFVISIRQTVPNKKHQELINRLADALSDFNNGLEIIRINKAMRNEFKELAGIKISYPNVHQLSKEKKKMDVKEMANEAIKTSFFQIQFKNYQDFFDFHKQDNITFLSKLNRWVLKLTSLAEFIGLVSEDVKSATAFGSITNDNIHLTYGLSCQFFITADIRLYKKAKFIKSWLNLKSNVFLIDEFIEYVLRSAYFPTNEFTSKEKFAKFVFTDKEGTVIKEYTLALEQKN